MQRRWLGGGLGAAFVLAACTAGNPPAARPAPSAEPSARTGSPSCPGEYAPLDPDRPRVRLHFTLGAGHDEVLGREQVDYTPDRPITELVFRLVPRAPPSRQRGAALVVTLAGIDGQPVRGTAAEPTTLRLPLPGERPAGRRVRAELAFRLRLPPAGVDRFGHTDRIAWWGSGHPLQAAVRGRGWVTGPPARTAAEFVATEAAATETTVIAPAADTVLMTGGTGPPTPAGAGRRQWRAVAAGARDVGVAVAPFRTATGTADGVPITVGVAPGVRLDPAVVLARSRSAVTGHARRLGPFGYATLAVAVLPGIGRSGVEYPAAVFLGDQRTELVVDHEIAHQWFYGLLGNDQGRDPWLDEAFATYAQALLDGIDIATYRSALRAPGAVRSAVDSFAPGPAYGTVVYAKGAAALLSARDRAGADRFDAALRCYLRLRVAGGHAGRPRTRPGRPAGGARGAAGRGCPVTVPCYSASENSLARRVTPSTRSSSASA